jgi:hypothetical protein
VEVTLLLEAEVVRHRREVIVLVPLVVMVVEEHHQASQAVPSLVLEVEVEVASPQEAEEEEVREMQFIKVMDRQHLLILVLAEEVRRQLIRVITQAETVVLV